MDGDEMRKTNTFFWRNRYKIAVVCMLIAAVGFTGVYLYSGREKSEPQKQQVAVKDTEQKEEIKNSVTAKTDVKEEDTEEQQQKSRQQENCILIQKPDCSGLSAVQSS